MKKLSLLAIPILVLFLASSFVWAEAGDHNIRFGFKYISPTGDLDYSYQDAEDIDGTMVEYCEHGTLEADAALGFGFGYEYMFTDLIGIDFNLNYAKHDMNIEGLEELTVYEDPPVLTQLAFDETLGETSLMPLTIGVNFHVYRSEAMEFYLGPFIGYVMYSDIELKYKDPGDTDISLNDDLGYGMAFGIDVPFGSKGWMFSSVLKYMQTKGEIDDPDPAIDGWEVDINPLILQVGLGYQF